MNTRILEQLLNNEIPVIYESGGMVIRNGKNIGYSIVIGNSKGEPKEADYIPKNRIACGKHAAFIIDPGMKYVITCIDEAKGIKNQTMYNIFKGYKHHQFKNMAIIEMEETQEPIPEMISKAGYTKALAYHCMNPLFLTNKGIKKIEEYDIIDTMEAEFSWNESQR